MSFFPLKTREMTITENGNKFLYKPLPDKLSNIHNYFSKKLITNEQLLNAKSGLYTWILRKSGNFYAIKSITQQEVGTLHANLKLLTDSFDSSNIEGAGELEIIKEENFVPPSIIFNLLSGTYMSKKFEKLSAKNTLVLRNDIIKNVQSTLINFNIPSQFLECSGVKCSKEEKIGGMKLIETANIKTSLSKLEKLNRMFIRTGGKGTRKVVKRRKTRKVRSKE
jgi:hypothetical protein